MLDVPSMEGLGVPRACPSFEDRDAFGFSTAVCSIDGRRHKPWRVPRFAWVPWIAVPGTRQCDLATENWLWQTSDCSAVARPTLVICIRPPGRGATGHELASTATATGFECASSSLARRLLARRERSGWIWHCWRRALASPGTP